MNKMGVLYVTFILPKPVLCEPCNFQKDKDYRLIWILNVLYIHYIWCTAIYGDRPCFLWFLYLLCDFCRWSFSVYLVLSFKKQNYFYAVLTAFIKLVQTQFSRKIKVFQSDGGSEFVNNIVRKIFEDNGTFHQISCPYTPQQNGRAERKHRHIVETGLAMLFHSHVPASY